MSNERIRERFIVNSMGEAFRDYVDGGEDALWDSFAGKYVGLWPDEQRLLDAYERAQDPKANWRLYAVIDGKGPRLELGESLDLVIGSGEKEAIARIVGDAGGEMELLDDDIERDEQPAEQWEITVPIGAENATRASVRRNARVILRAIEEAIDTATKAAA